MWGRLPKANTSQAPTNSRLLQLATTQQRDDTPESKDETTHKQNKTERKTMTLIYIVLYCS